MPWTEIVGWVLGGGLGLFVLDRSLLSMEDRGWIYYRRTRPGRGASTYHLLEMSSIFNPGFEAVQEVRAKEEKQEQESGDPPADDDPESLDAAGDPS